MPPSLRNRTQALDPDDTDSEIELHFGGGGGHPGQPNLQQQEDVEFNEEDEDEEEDDLIDPSSPANPNQAPLPNNDPPPPYLRDISTLASWTVSSSKPGCSIPQLRHPSTSLFWQSDGPQPHYLNIHFFKLVRVVALRLYLDLEIDESYTPTRIVFLAGSGGNDLVEWGELRCENPRGWVWVDFSGVDDDSGDEDVDEEVGDTAAPRLQFENTPRDVNVNDASSDSENNNPHPHQLQTPTAFPHPHLHTPHLPPSAHTPSNRPSNHQRTPLTSLPQPPNTMTPAPERRPHMPVLRAHLIQIKILENHQNGKDTHLRGLQVFARNDDFEGRRAKRDGGRGAERTAGGGRRRKDEDLTLGGMDDFEMGGIR